MTATPDEPINVTPGAESAFELAKQQALATHRRLERIDDWECDGFEPAVGADGELVYCESCLAIVWRRA